MKNYYLRVEAVNLSETVYDTNDISTIRGGGFLLLDAFNNLEEGECPEIKRALTRISKGASTGLYKFSARDDQDAEELRQEVLGYLRKFTHDATFVADYLVCSDDQEKEFQKDLKMLMAKNHWSQFQQPTIILPVISKETIEACHEDGVRPGVWLVDPNVGPEKRQYYSDFTYKRRKKGQELRKNKLYQDLLKNFSDQFTFTRELEALSTAKDQDNMDSKIAFIYLDGNKFGLIRDKTCNSANILKKFDKTIQEELREKILAALLDRACQDPEFKTMPPPDQQAADSKNNAEDSKEQIRLETLLWGGDEVEWVVPAWKGWEVLELFYQHQKKFQPSEEKEAIPLTHGCGIVFCAHNTPIREVRNIAHALAESAKDYIKCLINKRKSNNPNDQAGYPTTFKEGNWIQYLVLESFDMIEGSIDNFVKRYYQPASFDDLRIAGDEIPTLQKYIPVLRQYFPHNKVYQILKVLQSESETDKPPKINILLERAMNEMSDQGKERVKEALQKLLKEDNLKEDNLHRWFMIADLWDYIGDPRNEEKN